MCHRGDRVRRPEPAHGRVAQPGLDQAVPMAMRVSGLSIEVGATASTRTPRSGRAAASEPVR